MAKKRKRKVHKVGDTWTVKRRGKKVRVKKLGKGRYSHHVIGAKKKKKRKSKKKRK